MPAMREQLTKLRLAWADVLYAISDVFQGWANEVYIKGSRARASETEDRLADVRADLERIWVSGVPAEGTFDNGEFEGENPPPTLADYQEARRLRMKRGGQRAAGSKADEEAV